MRLTDAAEHLKKFNNASRFTGGQLLGFMAEVLQVLQLGSKGRIRRTKLYDNHNGTKFNS